MPTPKKTAKKVTTKKKSAEETAETVDSTTAAETAAAAPAETSGKTKTSAKATPAAKSEAAPAETASTKATAQSASQQTAPQQAAPQKPASQIDAGAHAHSAVASLLASRNKQNQAASTPAANESAAFKKLKEGLGKPSIGTNSPIGGNAAFPKQGGHSNQFNRQPLHRQAFNANANRTGVPRRTSGG